MDAKVFRVNYKSDFILTLTSDAGWMTPFCIKFWTGSPTLAYYASYDGETHVHCTYDPAEPTKLTVQFDDHHLPIGNLKYQVAYHFTVADFPENTEDEVTNQANVTTVIDGDTYQVMLDLNGETAPEIQFALPAYANELQRIQNEQTRIAQEQQRITNEQTRINQEAARVTEFNGIKAEALADHQRADNDHTRAANDHTQANADHLQADNDHARAESDHLQANIDHNRAESDHATATADHDTASADHTLASTDHSQAESDHTRAESDHTTATADHNTASADHTQANTDHTRAESDHQRVETDLAEVEEFSNSLGPYDISAAHATGSTLATYPDIATALGQNGSNIQEALRKGGMSVKFVHSYDKKYAQYFLTKDEWSASEGDWEKMNLEEELSQLGENVKDDYGEYVDEESFIDVKTDAVGHILEAIKPDGTKMLTGDTEVGGDINIGGDTEVVGDIKIGSSFIKSIEVDAYIDVKTDNDGKVIEGIKKDGTKEVNVDTELNGKVSVLGNKAEVIEHNKYIEVETDADGRILEGMTKDGEKHISAFDPETKEVISKIVGVSSGAVRIPELDANFTSPFPVSIVGTKGNEDAQYVFTFPLSEDAFNIRFKFHITENLLNQNKSAVIASLGGTSAITAAAVALTQYTTAVQYDGQTKTMYWPTFNGGISLNGSSTAEYGQSRNIGLFAFSVKYTGESQDVTLQNTGSAFVLSVDGVSTTFSFTDYPTVYELYEALKATSDIEVSYNELEGRNSEDLAKFPATKLVAEYYTGTHGGDGDEIEDYWDAAPLFVPYAVDEGWHQAEIVKLGNNVYAVCDGIVQEITLLNYRNLTLGGDCGVLFKDFEVYTDSPADAELAGGIIISSVNPYIIIHEGHQIIKTPEGEIDIEVGGNHMGVSVDRLQRIYSYMKTKGYVPVSVYDIAEYYAGNKNLPKRCFVSIFDDYRWKNCLDLDNRAVFTRFNVFPALAIITSYNQAIYHNGTAVTPQEAATMCRIYKFDLVSHTRSHRYTKNIKPSKYMEEEMADVYDADDKLVDGSILVYPFGNVNIYFADTLKWLGFKLGIDIVRNVYNIRGRSKYALTRISIAADVEIDDILTIAY